MNVGSVGCDRTQRYRRVMPRFDYCRENASNRKIARIERLPADIDRLYGVDCDLTAGGKRERFQYGQRFWV